MSIIEQLTEPTEKSSFTLEHFFGTGPQFELIRELRASFNYDVLEEEIDRHARHYYVMQEGQPLFTVRIARWHETPLDIESVMPYKPRPEDRPHMATASVFLSKAGFARTLAFTRKVWEHEVAAGIRADMIVVRLQLVNYYKRLGYRPFKGDPVIHPRTHRECMPMALVCDGDLRGGYAEVCGKVTSGELGARLKPMLEPHASARQPAPAAAPQP
ncbi:MAG: hypothetical protein EP335_09535 [Alphaproteobacteria bacterium]|nr:MAG: hypothetical protein EP335_09535 [Alphaproteobacteria bacterium]